MGTTFLALADVSCKAGYLMAGTGRTKCNESEKSSADTRYILIDCQENEVRNGSLFGANGTVQCDPGYVLSGTGFVQCLDTGLLSAESECLILGSPSNTLASVWKTAVIFGLTVPVVLVVLIAVAVVCFRRKLRHTSDWKFGPPEAVYVNSPPIFPPYLAITEPDYEIPYSELLYETIQDGKPVITPQAAIADYMPGKNTMKRKGLLTSFTSGWKTNEPAIVLDTQRKSVE